MPFYGEYLRSHRHRAGLSQVRLAQLAKSDPFSISKFENSHTVPATATVERLARALGIRIDDLFKSDEAAAQ